MNSNDQTTDSQEEEPVSQPDQNDPDMEYVEVIPTEEFVERIEQQTSDNG